MSTNCESFSNLKMLYTEYVFPIFDSFSHAEQGLYLPGRIATELQIGLSKTHIAGEMSVSG